MGIYDIMYNSNDWTFYDGMDYEEGLESSRGGYTRYFNWEDSEDREILIECWKKHTSPRFKRCWKAEKDWRKLKNETLKKICSVGLLDFLKHYDNGSDAYDSVGMILVNNDTGQFLESILTEWRDNENYAAEAPEPEMHGRIIEEKNLVGPITSYKCIDDIYYKNKEIWLRALLCNKEDDGEISIKYDNIYNFDGTNLAVFKDINDNTLVAFNDDQRKLAREFSKQRKALKAIEIL